MRRMRPPPPELASSSLLLCWAVKCTRYCATITGSFLATASPIHGLASASNPGTPDYIRRLPEQRHWQRRALGGLLPDLIEGR